MQYVVAITDRDTGEVGYVRQLYAGGKYSMLRGPYNLRTVRGEAPPMHKAGDEGTVFDIERAAALLAKINARFSDRAVPRWFVNPRIEILDFDKDA